MSENQLQSIQDKIKEGEKELDALDRKMKDQRGVIHSLRGELWDLCNHQWRRDCSCAFDDPCKYYCNVCGLWKDRSLYGS